MLYRNRDLAQMLPIVILSLGSTTAMCAGTINFTYTINGSSTLGTQPSMTVLTVPETFIGSGSSAPSGPLTDSEVASFTFSAGPPGFFAPASEPGTFIFSTHGGTDTFSGTEADPEDLLHRDAPEAFFPVDLVGAFLDNDLLHQPQCIFRAL